MRSTWKECGPAGGKRPGPGLLDHFFISKYYIVHEMSKEVGADIGIAVGALFVIFVFLYFMYQTFYKRRNSHPSFHNGDYGRHDGLNQGTKEYHGRDGRWSKSSRYSQR